MDYVNVDIEQIYNFKYHSPKHYNINTNTNDIIKLANSLNNKDDSKTYSKIKNKTINI